MIDAHLRSTNPQNEPVLDHRPGSPERERLVAELERVAGSPEAVPVVIGGEPIETGDRGRLRCPHDHALDLGTYCRADEKLTRRAIDAAVEARAGWMRRPPHERAAIFLRAAQLLAGNPPSS